MTLTFYKGSQDSTVSTWVSFQWFRSVAWIGMRQTWMSQRVRYVLISVRLHIQEYKAPSIKSSLGRIEEQNTPYSSCKNLDLRTQRQTLRPKYVKEAARGLRGVHWRNASVLHERNLCSLSSSHPDITGSPLTAERSLPPGSLGSVWMWF